MIASSLEHVLSPLSMDTLSVITNVCLHVMDHLKRDCQPRMTKKRKVLKYSVFYNY